MILADLTLRFGSRRVPTIVQWPLTPTASLALVLGDELSPSDPWVNDYLVVGLTGRHPEAIELAVLLWVSEHGAELGAAGDGVIVAGGARAAALALAARDGDWPSVCHQLLVHPRFTPTQPMPNEIAGAPPATVVCGSGSDGGRQYAARLRAGAVEVDEVHDGRRG